MAPASLPPVDSHAQVATAAAATQVATTSNPFLDPSAPPVSVPPPSSPPSQTVINQPVIERIIERVVPQGGSGISADKLAAILTEFGQSIESRIAAVASAPIAFSGPAATTPLSTATFAPSQRIDQLTNTSINTPTITGGSISGATVSGTLSGTFSGAASALSIPSIPWGLLATDGSGNFLATSTPTAAAYIATSTTATSTFAGGLTAANGSFSILQNGNVGIGTAAPSIAGVNSNSRVLSIVGDGTLVNARGVLELANPRASGSLAANDTAGSAFFVMSNNSGNPYIAGILGSLSGSGGANGFGGKLQFQTKADNDASSATTKMVLDQNGNVGIGTTTPGALLGVNGNILGAGTLALTGTTGTTTIAAGQGFTIGGSQFVLQQGSGNVGLNVANPGATLSINGGIGLGGAGYSDAGQTTGSLTMSGSLAVGVTGSAAKLAVVGSIYANPATTDTIFPGSVGTANAAFIGPNAYWAIRSATNNSFNLDVTTPTSLTAMTVLQNGNVGIGTASPQTKLHLSGTSAAASGTSYTGLLTLQGSNTATLGIGSHPTVPYGLWLQTGDTSLSSQTYPLLLNPLGGNVGIGTTSPANQLHIVGSSPVRIDSSTDGSSLLLLRGTGAITQQNIAVQFEDTAGVAKSFAQIRFLPTDRTAGSEDADLAFFLRNAGSLNEAVRITGTGNVGIGMSNPAQKLDVNGTIRIASTLQFYNTGGSSYVAGSMDASQYQFSVSGSEKMRIDTTGNVGIGTTTPGSKLVVQGLGMEHWVDASTNYRAEQIGSGRIGLLGNRNDYFLVYDTQNLRVGIGTTTPWGKLSVTGSGTGTGLAFAVADSANTPRFVIQDNGNVGVGTSSPTAQLHTTGTVRFSNFGAGTLTTDASGNLSVSSDERLKNIDGGFNRGLAEVMMLNPISYHWNETSGLDMTTQYSGFSAQNVQAAIPEAVGSSTNGYLTLQDRPLIAALVNAVKEIAQRFTDLAERVVTKELAFVRAEGDDLMLNHQLCIRDGAADPNPICLTKSQVAAVLSMVGQQGVSVASAASSTVPVTQIATSTPPIIQINGANPAVIHVGDTYADLGATITGPQESLNLGIKTYLDSVETTAFTFHLDTSTTSTSTIDYVVTDAFGQTATATRTVVVE
ncbi:DUF5011 domain-containing protein [Candidatus Kaiserbacteria bacterium]|nr:DUF5011 domain-containing protein [Candidatus Kaiserbacteria bacterium]